MDPQALAATIREVAGTDHPAVLSIPQVAQILGLSVVTIRRMIRTGVITPIPIAGIVTIRIPINELYRVLHVAG